MTSSKELRVPLKWGHLCGQIFGEPSPEKRPIVAFHGFLDNSNSFKPIAPFLTANNEYYLISVDLPGHGFSSHIPTGMYSPKMMLFCIRRLIKYLQISNVILLSHSYGCNLNLMYTACFPDEVVAVILIDYAVFFGVKIDSDHMMKLWRSGIDHLIDIFYNDNSEKNHGDLTEDLALQLLLKKNTTLNTDAAKLLLQRAIIKRDDKVMFSRDPILKDQVRWKAKNLGKYSNDHYAEWYSGFDALKECSTNPTLLLLSSPSFFADGFNDMTISSLKQTKNKLDVVYVNGTHHFHMIKPEEVSVLILKFLNENLGKRGSKVVNSKL